MASSSSQRKAREINFEKWLNSYKTLFEKKFKSFEFSYKINAAKLLNDSYWNFIEKEIRPYMRGGNTHIDHHKIISTVEFSIMWVLPLCCDNMEERIYQNARLALVIGKTILKSWNKGEFDLKDDNFEREHLTLLVKWDFHKAFPLFSNSATWYLYEKCCQLKQEKQYAGA